jgi:1-deoxy-D-xylulose-5-phosphate synthase
MRAIPIGRGELLRDGTDVALIGIGQTVSACVDAADQLSAEGISAAVVNARFAKPLDEQLILDVARRTRGIITAEEHVRAGGFGEAVLSLLAEHGLADRVLSLRTMPDAIVDHGPQKTFRSVYGLDGPGLATVATERLGALAAGTLEPQPLPVGGN